jgi:hypothetical protein
MKAEAHRDDIFITPLLRVGVVFLDLYRHYKELAHGLFNTGSTLLLTGCERRTGPIQPPIAQQRFLVLLLVHSPSTYNNSTAFQTRLETAIRS